MERNLTHARPGLERDSVQGGNQMNVKQPTPLIQRAGGPKLYLRYIWWINRPKVINRSMPPGRHSWLVPNVKEHIILGWIKVGGVRFPCRLWVRNFILRGQKLTPIRERL